MQLKIIFTMCFLISLDYDCLNSLIHPPTDPRASPQLVWIAVDTYISCGCPWSPVTVDWQCLQTSPQAVGCTRNIVNGPSQLVCTNKIIKLQPPDSYKAVMKVMHTASTTGSMSTCSSTSVTTLSLYPLHAGQTWHTNMVAWCWVSVCPMKLKVIHYQQSNWEHYCSVGTSYL